MSGKDYKSVLPEAAVRRSKSVEPGVEDQIVPKHEQNGQHNHHDDADDDLPSKHMSSFICC